MSPILWVVIFLFVVLCGSKLFWGDDGVCGFLQIFSGGLLIFPFSGIAGAVKNGWKGFIIGGIAGGVLLVCSVGSIFILGGIDEFLMHPGGEYSMFGVMLIWVPCSLFLSIIGGNVVGGLFPTKGKFSWVKWFFIFLALGVSFPLIMGLLWILVFTFS